MKCLILFMVCSVLGELPVTTILPELEPETLTDLPKEAIEDFKEGVTMQARQSYVEDDNEISTDLPAEEVSSTTVHFTQMACLEDHMVWSSCGPRCYQTCAFQPRGSRRSRAICESVVSTNCYAGCFCESGYVRLNDKCVLPIDCPSKFKNLS